MDITRTYTHIYKTRTYIHILNGYNKNIHPQILNGYNSISNPHIPNRYMWVPLTVCSRPDGSLFCNCVLGSCLPPSADAGAHSIFTFDTFAAQASTSPRKE